MTTSRSAKTDQTDQTLEEALAVLISCTRNKRRPLSLTEIAKWLRIAVKKLGSHKAVADRIGLSTKMLRQFSYVDRLAKPVQKLFEDRVLDSVDAATHLAMLQSGDQQAVATELAAKHLDTSDVRAVQQLHETREAEPIAQIVREVIESKTKQEYVAEFVIRGKPHIEKLTKAFQKYIDPGDIIRVEVHGALGRLILTPKGRQALSRAAKQLGVPVRHVISRILDGF